jgi:hypothetical protein
MSIHDRLKDADERVDRAEEALERAWDELRDAKNERDTIETMAQAAAIAEATGPQKPIGDRVVRQSCPLSEIPEWFGKIDPTDAARTVIGERMYATNGHVMIVVDSVDGLEVVRSNGGAVDPAKIISANVAPLVRLDVPVMNSCVLCRDFGSTLVQLKYASLVEDLFPGCEWWSTTTQATHALVDGRVVAVVMPIRRDTPEAA